MEEVEVEIEHIHLSEYYYHLLVVKRHCIFVLCFVVFRALSIGKWQKLNQLILLQEAFHYLAYLLCSCTYSLLQLHKTNLQQNLKVLSYFVPPSPCTCCSLCFDCLSSILSKGFRSSSLVLSHQGPLGGGGQGF